MPTARAFISASAVKGNIHFIGGRRPDGLLSTVEEYDTGLAVEAKEKLVTTWGAVKSTYRKP